MVERLQVSGEEANFGQASGDPYRSAILGLGRPNQGRFNPDMGFSAILGKSDELAKKSLGLVQLVAEGTAHGQIIGKGLTQSAHWSPSGQGRAIVRSLSKSTLA